MTKCGVLSDVVFINLAVDSSSCCTAKYSRISAAVSRLTGVYARIGCNVNHSIFCKRNQGLYLECESNHRYLVAGKPYPIRNSQFAIRNYGQNCKLIHLGIQASQFINETIKYVLSIFKLPTTLL
jgi:hypothetical protein